ncbi:MAG: hypothetical protein HY788_16670 [Deltaproteobacteria bacterium]|nr:hypothetical protein [Deltaproteobacteria bacterium]
MSIITAWVKNTSHTKGLDPLGVQAPCINLYGRLLPGITNVTDRARYYSFYPWAVWAYDQLPGAKSFEDLTEWMRRSDCLFTMVGIRHRTKSGDNDFFKHDKALVGRAALEPAVIELSSGGSVPLSKFTVRGDGDPYRYFKNPLGGLKQYYIGAFASLGLMKSSGRSIAYTNERGKPIAVAMDAEVDRRLFADTIHSDEITADRLDALAGFCPCQLQRSVQEHEQLVSLFFDKSSDHGDKGKQRRHTLGLLLDLIRALPKPEGAFGVELDHRIFQGCVYSGYLPSGQAWNLPLSLERVRQGWAVYQRNELLSVALQCIFWVALKCIEEVQNGVATTEDFIEWISSSTWVKDATTEVRSEEFEELLKQTASNLPPVGDWQREEHEVSRAQQALETYSQQKKREVRVELLVHAARILVSLVARDDKTKAAYGSMSFPAEYFSLYPINLESLRKLSRSSWPGMATTAWFAWLAGHWGIEAHLRVALRKLRHQNQHTFQVSNRTGCQGHYAWGEIMEFFT